MCIGGVSSSLGRPGWVGGRLVDWPGQARMTLCTTVITTLAVVRMEKGAVSDSKSKVCLYNVNNINTNSLYRNKMHPQLSFLGCFSVFLTSTSGVWELLARELRGFAGPLMHSCAL